MANYTQNTLFNGKTISEFNMMINNVEFDVLPNRTNSWLNTPYKNGDTFLKSRLDNKPISVTITAYDIDGNRANIENNIMLFRDSLNLTSDEPVILGLNYLKNSVTNNEIVNYRVVYDGEISITDESRQTVTFIILFRVVDGYGETKTITTSGTNTLTVENNGEMNTEPVIEVNFTKDTETFEIQLDDNKFIKFGGYTFEDEEVEDLSPVVLDDDCSSAEFWTESSQDSTFVHSVDLTSDGESLYPESNNYTGIGWNGSTVVRSLGQELQDFELKAEFWTSSDPAQINSGRFELVGRDINGKQIFKFALVKPKGKNNTYKMEAIVGDANGGTGAYYKFFDSYAPNSKPHLFRFNKSKPNPVMMFGRKGQLFYVKTFHGYHDNGTVVNLWTDEHNQMSDRYGAKLAQIEIRMGMMGTYEDTEELVNVNTKFKLHNLKITNLRRPKNNKTVGFIFKRGDRLIINGKTGEISLNGLPHYSTLHPASDTDFLSLSKGIHTIETTPNVANIKVKINNRFY